MEEGRVVDLVSVNEVKNKSVRGLLKKRAKQYDSDSDTEKNRKKDDPADKKGFHGKKDEKVVKKKQKGYDQFGNYREIKNKKVVVKSSFQDAFKSIMGAASKDKVEEKKAKGGESVEDAKVAAPIKPLISKKFKEDNRSEETKEQQAQA